MFSGKQECQIKYNAVPRRFIHLIFYALQLTVFEQILLKDEVAWGKAIMQYEVLGHRVQTYGSWFKTSNSRYVGLLYEGVQVNIVCIANSSSENVSVVKSVKKTAIKTENESYEGIGSISHIFRLAAKLIGTTFACKPKSIFTSETFEISELQCNPFGFLPQAMHCKSPDVCLVRKDGSAYCSVLQERNCFLAKDTNTMKANFKASFPEHKFVCNGAQSLENVFGSCHAQSLNIQKVESFTNDDRFCSEFAVKLNNKNVYANGLLIENINPRHWNITYKHNRKNSPEVLCELEDFHRSVEAYKDEEIGNQMKLASDLNSFINYKIPQKLFLFCEAGYSIATSFVLLYDPQSSVFKPEIFPPYFNSGTAPLICRSSVPTGFFCALSWKNFITDYTLQSFVTKPLTNECYITQTVTKNIQGPDPKVYTCFSSIYLFEYPNSDKLIELTDLRLNVSIPIYDDRKGSKTGTGASPATIDDKGSENSKSGTSTSPATIVLGVALPLLFLTFVIIAVTVYCGLKKNKEILKFAETAYDADAQGKCDGNFSPALSTFKSSSKTGKIIRNSNLEKSINNKNKKQSNARENFKQGVSKKIFAKKSIANSLRSDMTAH